MKIFSAGEFVFTPNTVWGSAELVLDTLQGCPAKQHLNK